MDEEALKLIVYKIKSKRKKGDKLVWCREKKAENQVIEDSEQGKDMKKRRINYLCNMFHYWLFFNIMYFNNNSNNK